MRKVSTRGLGENGIDERYSGYEKTNSADIWAYLIIKGVKNILLRVRDDMGVTGSSFTFGAGTIKKGTCQMTSLVRMQEQHLNHRQ